MRHGTQRVGEEGVPGGGRDDVGEATELRETDSGRDRGRRCSHVGCSPVRSCSHQGNLAEALGLDCPGQGPGALSSSTWTGLPGVPRHCSGNWTSSHFPGPFSPKKSLAFPGIEMKNDRGPQKLAPQAEPTMGTWAKETAFCAAWEGRHTWCPWRSVYGSLPRPL